MSFISLLSDDTIDESYGVAVVFNEEEDEREQGGRGKETSVAHDDDDIPEDDDEEGVEADYDEVLKSGVSKSRCTSNKVQWNLDYSDPFVPKSCQVSNN